MVLGRRKDKRAVQSTENIETFKARMSSVDMAAPEMRDKMWV